MQLNIQFYGTLYFQTKRFTHHQHEIEVTVFIGQYGGRHQRRQFEKEQIDNEEH